MPTTANSGEFRWGWTGRLVIIELWQGPCGSPPLLWYWFPSAPEPTSSQAGHKIMVQVQRGRFPTINQNPHAWRTPRYTSRVETQTVPPVVSRIELLTISGSLRAVSSNRMLLQAAIELAPPEVTVRPSNHLAMLPHFNPDLDGEARPLAADAWRVAVGRADGLLFSTPEYAHGLPGAFKNGLDWLVSDPALLHKPIAIWNVSARGTYAQASLVEILRTMSTRIVDEAGVTLPLQDSPLELRTLVETPALREMLRAALAAFVRAIREHPAQQP